jgi:ice-binding like protein
MMNYRSLFWKPAAAVLLLSFASACGDDEGDGTADGGSGTTARAGSSGRAATGGSSNRAGSGGRTGNMDVAGQARPVELGTADDYAILAKTGVDTVPPSVITGDVGCSPAAATYITGFSPLTADSTATFSSSPQVTGKVYASTYTAPTPSKLTTAIGDMETAFTDAAGRAPDFTEKGAGNIGGLTLVPGTYQWSTGLLIPTDVTLNGGASAVWIFQIAEDLTVANGTDVVLAGGASAKNIFWQVSGAVEVGTTAHLEGIVMSRTAITLGTGSSIKGRLLAQTAVNIQTSTVVEPN